MPKKTQNNSQKQAQRTEPEYDDEDKLNMVVFDTFDINRFTLRPKNLDDQKDDPQFLCFPQYYFGSELPEDVTEISKNSESVLVVTEDIPMEKGGIPKYDKKYYDSEDAMGRAYFYIPLIKDSPGSVALFNWVEQIDDHYDNEINKLKNKNEVVCYYVKNKKNNELVAKPFKDLTYKRMITEPKPKKMQPGEEEEDSPKKEYESYKRIKVKFGTIWDENLGPRDRKDIDTLLFIPGEDDPVPATKVSDFDKHFKWRSTCKFGLRLNKFWISKTDERDCSFGFKCVQLAVTKEPSEGGQKKLTASQLGKNLFTGKKLPNVSEMGTDHGEKLDKKNDDVGDEDGDEDGADEDADEDADENEDEDGADEDEPPEENVDEDKSPEENDNDDNDEDSPDGVDDDDDDEDEAEDEAEDEDDDAPRVKKSSSTNKSQTEQRSKDIKNSKNTPVKIVSKKVDTLKKKKNAV